MGHESDDTTYNNNYGKDCTITAVYHLDKETGRKRFKEFPNSAKDWDEFLCQLQQKFNLQKPVMKNYRIDYQIKDKDGKLSPECYGLTEDDEFQYALTGID